MDVHERGANNENGRILAQRSIGFKAFSKHRSTPLHLSRNDTHNVQSASLQRMGADAVEILRTAEGNKASVENLTLAQSCISTA